MSTLFSSLRLTLIVLFYMVTWKTDKPLLLSTMLGSKDKVAMMQLFPVTDFVEFSDKTLYFAFCDTQSHSVTMTTIVLHSYIIYLPPLIVISMLAYVWCTFEILI